VIKAASTRLKILLIRLMRSAEVAIAMAVSIMMASGGALFGRFLKYRRQSTEIGGGLPLASAGRFATSSSFLYFLFGL
jgi:hypothetical protein